MRDIVVVGCGPAGLWAAISARATNPSAKVTILTNEKYLTYSRCGLPYVIKGDIESFENLIITSINKLKNMKINVHTESKVTDVIGNEVLYERNGHSGKIKFDSLIIATGAKPSVPRIPGASLNGVYTLRTIDDGRKIMNQCENAKKAIIIGAGAIGLEVAEALVKRGIDVSVIEIMPRVLPSILDNDMASILHNIIKRNNINLMLNSRVEEIIGNLKVEKVIVNGKDYGCDFIVMATGVKPNTELARKIGVKIGSLGGIEVNEYMQTSVEGIYAAGDCVETKHLVTGKPFLPLLGTVAYRQGKVAGINAAGGKAIFRGCLGSVVLKVFNVEVGSTGLTVERAKNENFNIVIGKVKWVTRAEYYPDHKDIIVKLIFNADDGKIIGGQIIGGEGVAQRINLIAAAIQCGMNAEDIASIDTCYSPPVADTIEPVTRAAEIALKKLKR